MKLRTGFVSNSSSSSFIIAIDKGTRCEHCGRADLDILSMIRSSTDSVDDNSVDAVGVKDILGYIDDWCLEDDVVSKIKKKLEKAVKAGKEVAAISISYHDETMQSLIKDAKNVEMIFNVGD